MTDIEDLLTRALGDERRVLRVPPGAAAGVRRQVRRLELRRRIAMGATAVIAVVVIAGGTMLADGGSAQDGRVPSYDASVGTQPRATSPAAAATSAAPQPSPTPAPGTS